MNGGLLTRIGRLPASMVILGVLLATTTPIRAVGRGLLRVGWEPPAVVLVFVLDTITSGVSVWVLTWLLYGSAIHYLLPRVYPAEAGTVLRQVTPSRYVVTAGTVVTGVVFERSMLGEFTGSPLPGGIVPPILVLVVCGGVVPLCAVVLAQRSASTEVEGVLGSVLEQFLPRKDGGGEVTGLLGTIIGGILVGFVGLVFLWITFLVVLAALAAVLLFPLPEVLTGIGLVVVAVVPDRAERWRRATDIETRLLTLGRVGTYGFKGIFSVLLPVVGIGFAAIASFVILTIGWMGIPEYLSGQHSLGRILQSVVVLVAVIGASWFALWYWLRVLDRLPHFIAAWNETQPVELETPDPARPFRARPPGLLVQPTLVFAILALPLEYPRSLLIVPLLLAVCGLLIVSVRWTRRIDPAVADRQPPISDNRAIPAAFLVFLGGFGLVHHRSEIASVIAGDPDAFGPLASTGVSLLAVVALFYYADAIRPLMASDRSLTLRDVGRLVGLAAVAVAVGTVYHGPLVGVAIVVVLVIAALVVA